MKEGEFHCKCLTREAQKCCKEIIKQKKNCTNLDKAERQEGNIVSAEERVEQYFFDSPVKVALQLLHLRPN